MTQRIGRNAAADCPSERCSIVAAYHEHKHDMLTAAVCLLGGDRQAAEDVLHDVFVSLAKRDEIVVHSNLRNYLITACLNRARDILRKRNRAGNLSDRLDDEASTAGQPHEQFEQSEEAAILLDALHSLPAAQREVVSLHIYGQLKFREIAEASGISINTAQSRYRYAIEALRKTLEKSF